MASDLGPPVISEKGMVKTLGMQSVQFLIIEDSAPLDIWSVAQIVTRCHFSALRFLPTADFSATCKDAQTSSECSVASDRWKSPNSTRQSRIKIIAGRMASEKSYSM